MKKAITFLEISMLTLVLLSFTWTRYAPTLSRPIALNLSPMNLTFTGGLTLAVLLKIILSLKSIRTGTLASTQLQIGVLSFYLLMALKDLWLLVKWNYYVGDFYLVTTLLIAPIFLGITLMILGRKKETESPKNESNQLP